MQTPPCYSDHDHDIANVGACEICGGTIDKPGELPDQAPPVAGAVSQRYEVAKRVVANNQWEMLEKQMLDGMTAKGMVLVFEALSPANKAKFDQIPLLRLVDLVWKNVKMADRAVLTP